MMTNYMLTPVRTHAIQVLQTKRERENNMSLITARKIAIEYNNIPMIDMNEGKPKWGLPYLSKPDVPSLEETVKSFEP